MRRNLLRLALSCAFLFLAGCSGSVVAQPLPPVQFPFGGSGGGGGSCTGSFCSATAPLAANLGGNALDNSASTGVPLWTAGVQSILGTSGTGNVARVASPTFSGTLSAVALTLSGTLTTNITGGGVQCLHVSNTGVATGTGSDCGAGGSVSVTSASPNIVITPSPGTGTFTIGATYVINAQVGTSYTVLAGDGGKLITFNNASAIAVTLPQATGSFAAGYSFDVQNLGAGTVTITPITSTINGGATLAIAQNRGCTISSDGTNYQVSACTAIGAGSGTVTGATFTGGLISVSGSTTLAFTVAGTSGGIPYFSGGTTWASSAALAANSLVIGGGAGVAPSTITTGTGVLTALGNAVSGTGSICLSSGSACGGGGGSTYTTTFSGNASGTPGSAGLGIAEATATLTDNNTAGSGTAALFPFHSIAAPTFAATNATVTTTHATTLRIAGPPVAGTNETLTAVSAFSIAAGDAAFESNASKEYYYNVGGPGITNREAVRWGWISNVFTMEGIKNGTGTNRAWAINPTGDLNLTSQNGGLNLTAATGNSINFIMNGGSTTPFVMNINKLSSNASNGWWLGAASVSGTQPGFAPNINDLTTGIGAQASGNISLTTGAAERVRVQSTGMFMQSGLLGLKSFTVAGLPTGVTGGMAYVTDATTCTFATAPTGGGSTFCPVVYNGATWQAM